MKIRIHGASDYLIEVTGCDGADEFTSYEPGVLMWRGDLRAPNGEVMRVYGLYDGCWSFATGMVNEARPFPSWPLTITPLPGLPGSGFTIPHTVMLEIDAPDQTKLTNAWPQHQQTEGR